MNLIDEAKMHSSKTGVPFIGFGHSSYKDYDEIYLDKPAQQGVHLTALGVGLLALLVGCVVFLFKLLRKYGGK